MIWLFHRRGQYLSCEVRTCLENSGFELLMTGAGRCQLEWYADEHQVERRWEQVRDLLDRDGWGDVYDRKSRLSRCDLRLRVVQKVVPIRSAIRD
jgi:hypothetical protein